MAGFGTAEKELVLFADGRGANGVLYEIVVDLYLSVFGVDEQLVPEFEGVVDGFSGLAFGRCAICSDCSWSPMRRRMGRLFC